MPYHTARSLAYCQQYVILSRSLPAHATTATRRISASTRTCAKKDLPPPLPPSKNMPKKQQLSPVEAKQRYLESKKRTEEFLQDPQKKIHQLHSEIDQVREKLEREVYNKTVWQRLTDPLKRKQHSLINMIAASFAYVLAYQLHLKRQANQKLQDELDEQQQEQEELKRLLRSLLEEEYIQDMATAAAEEIGDASSSSRWSWSAPQQSTDSSLSQSQMDAIAQVLRQKLEEWIGDEGLDDVTKKERGIERIWKQNQEKLESEDDDIAGLLALAEEAAEGKPAKQKRVFDM